MKPCDQTCTSSNDSSVFSSHPLSQEASFLDSQLSFASVPSLAASPQHQCHVLNMNHRCVATLKGQNSYTSSLLLYGGFFFTGSSDGEIRLWKHDALRSTMDFENLTDDNMVVAGKGAVKALVAAEDKIISAHQDHKIRVWKVDELNNDHHKFTHLATLPTLSDRALKIFLPKNHVQVRRHKTCTWVHHVDTVSALAISSDESLLYSVSWDRTLKIWRTTDFKCLESIAKAHDDAINTIITSSDDHIYTGSSDKKIKVWKQTPGDMKHYLVATLEKHKSGVNALALSRDGSTLYSGAGDRSILVWTKTASSGYMAAAGALRGHTKSILCLATVSDLLCSGSADNTVRIWRGIEKSYSCVAVLEGHKGPVKCITVAFDPTSETISTYLLYSASLDFDIKVWQIFLPPE
ncbi:protein JINGUBANG-like [Primulina tabacum]|uniref:protein JINGUBANG-like n=1 Tax=Primulina tabacum TaxID=48773 RepID=UPI003F5A5928